MTQLTRRSFLVTAAAAPAALAALPALASAATHQVAIQGMAFAPATLNIARGDTVRWTNADNAPHTATFAGAGMATPRLGRGESGELTFDAAGSFDYACAIHPGMRGRIVVS